MYDLLRNLVFYAVILGGLCAGIAIYFYGTADPCRMLAKQQSDDTIESVTDILGGDDPLQEEGSPTLEGIFRAITAQYSTRECAQELGKIWIDDLSAWWDELVA